jgi:hypothetical protein
LAVIKNANFACVVGAIRYSEIQGERDRREQCGVALVYVTFDAYNQIFRGFSCLRAAGISRDTRSESLLAMNNAVYSIF